MALAHHAFTADTVVALHLERALVRRAAPAEAGESRWSVSAAVTAAVVEAVLPPDGEVAMWELLDGLLPTPRGSVTAPPPVGGSPGEGPGHLHVLGSTEPVEPADALGSVDAVDLAPVRAVMADIGPALRARHAAGVLEVGLVPWTVGVVAFHWNRFGLPLAPERLRAEVGRATAAARARARHGGGATSR